MSTEAISAPAFPPVRPRATSLRQRSFRQPCPRPPLAPARPSRSTEPTALERRLTTPGPHRLYASQQLMGSTRARTTGDAPAHLSCIPLLWGRSFMRVRERHPLNGLFGAVSRETFADAGTTMPREVTCLSLQVVLVRQTRRGVNPRRTDLTGAGPTARRTSTYETNAHERGDKPLRAEIGLRSLARHAARSGDHARTSPEPADRAQPSHVLPLAPTRRARGRLCRERCSPGLPVEFQ